MSAFCAEVRLFSGRKQSEKVSSQPEAGRNQAAQQRRRLGFLDLICQILWGFRFCTGF